MKHHRKRHKARRRALRADVQQLMIVFRNSDSIKTLRTYASGVVQLDFPDGRHQAFSLEEISTLTVELLPRVDECEAPLSDGLARLESYDAG